LVSRDGGQEGGSSGAIEAIGGISSTSHQFLAEPCPSTGASL